MNKKTIIASLLAAAAGQTASADIFHWANAIDGMWSNHANWSGPSLQSPDSVLDSAFLNGGNYDVVLDQNVSLGLLSVGGGADVLSNQHSIFVNGSVSIFGAGSTVSVSDSPQINDFDADSVQLDSGVLLLLDGKAQIDDSMSLVNGAGVLGTGVVEMNGSGDLDVSGGVLWAVGGGSTEELRFQRTGSSSARLAWSSADASIAVWDGTTLHNELPYNGAFGGQMQISGSQGGSTFVSDDAFVTQVGSEILLVSASVSDPARVEAPGIDVYGHVRVNGRGIIDAPLLALRGTTDLAEDARFTHTGALLMMDSFTLNSEGPQTGFGSTTFGATLNVVGGSSNINIGADGYFDLDGAGDRVVNIADGSELVLSAENLDTGNSVFNGTLNIEGDLTVNAAGNGDDWTNAGEVELDQGRVFGRRLVNTGRISGRGHLWSHVDNRGEIAAENGTLFVHQVNMDGTGTPQAGVLRAEIGDMVLTGNSNGGSFFTGDLYVGDGQGIREVFEMNTQFVSRTEDGKTGTVSLHSGRFRALDMDFYGELTSEGVSRLIVTGNNGAHRIGFGSQSVNAISGTLEVDGETWTVPGATFNGDGEIYAVSTVKRTFMQDGSDLGGVSLRSAGGVWIYDFFASGRANVAGFTMEPTASFHASIQGFGGDDISDRLIVAGDALLDGDLVLDLGLGDDSAIPGRSYVILEAGSVVGTFDEVDVSAVSDQFRAAVTYEPTQVSVYVTCLADINSDGMVNGLDFGAWLNAYNSDSDLADQNGDGVVNGLDFGSWLNNFNSGCGS